MIRNTCWYWFPNFQVHMSNLEAKQMEFNKLLMNFIWNEIKFIHMNWHVIRMKFIRTSYRISNEVDKLYPCNTNEVDMRIIRVRMKYIWISNDFNFMWTSCELNKNYMTSAQEVHMYYTWIWSLAFLLCTSYEWASRSIVLIWGVWAIFGECVEDWPDIQYADISRPSGQILVTGSGHFLENAWDELPEICMPVYLDHLHNWLDLGHGLLIVLVLGAFWFSEKVQI